MLGYGPTPLVQHGFAQPLGVPLSASRSGVGSTGDMGLCFRPIEPVSVGFEPSLLDHVRILRIGDQRRVREIGRMSPKIQKITPQRFRIVSLTRGNVAPIFANRTSPAETGLAGWAYRTRTGESVRDPCI